MAGLTVRNGLHSAAIAASLIVIERLSSSLITRLRSVSPKPVAEVQSFFFLPAASLPGAHALH